MKVSLRCSSAPMCLSAGHAESNRSYLHPAGRSRSEAQPGLLLCRSGVHGPESKLLPKSHFKVWLWTLTNVMKRYDSSNHSRSSPLHPPVHLFNVKHWSATFMTDRLVTGVGYHFTLLIKTILTYANSFLRLNKILTFLSKIWKFQD